MRTKVPALAFALLLASCGLAAGQSDQSSRPGQTGQAGQTGQTGQAGQTGQTGQASADANEPLPASPLTIDIGFRASSVDGDRARFERFQDIRKTGFDLSLSGAKEGDGYAVDFLARNVGYHDQQYNASFNGMGKVFANFSFFQLPLNYGFADDGYVQTPYGANLTLDAATRAAAQVGRAIAWTTNPTQTSAYVPLLHPIDLGSRRDQLGASLVYSPTRQIDLNVGVTTYKRSGTQPWSASWGFSNAEEVPLPLDNRTTNFTVGGAYTIDQLGVQLAFDHSKFTNNNDILYWDNPMAATDSPTRGAARGVMSVMPGNSMTTFRGSGIYRMPAHTSASVSFAVSRLDQDSALPPITSNSVLNAGAPARATAQAKADVSMVNLALNSRPGGKLWVTARFRYRDFTQKTPPYLSNVTIFDTSITLEDSTEPSDYLNFKTQNLQLGAAYSLIPELTARFDYFFNKVDQPGSAEADAGAASREWPVTKENVERVSLDSVAWRWGSLHANYTHSTRRGSGPYELPDGQQPATRMFDDADRTRNAGMVMLNITPLEMVGLSFSLNAGKDTYDDPAQQFGLLNNKNQVYTAGLDVTPNEFVSAGIAYGFEKYTALQQSRNALPAPSPTFFDPTNNWADNHEERVHTFTANLNVTHVVPNAELLFGYDYSHSSQAYRYSGPYISKLMALPPSPFAIGFSSQFAPLPDVIDTIHRLTANVRYFVTQHLAANVTYWFDKYDVEDFATPLRYDSPGAILLGYGWRPYKANTIFLNALYRF